MCIIATDMSMHAMITGSAELIGNVQIAPSFALVCRGMLVPSPNVGSGRMHGAVGGERGGEYTPRRASNVDAAAEQTGDGAGASRAHAGSSRAGRADGGGSTSGSE